MPTSKAVATLPCSVVSVIPSQIVLPEEFLGQGRLVRVLHPDLEPNQPYRIDVPRLPNWQHKQHEKGSCTAIHFYRGLIVNGLLRRTMSWSDQDAIIAAGPEYFNAHLLGLKLLAPKAAVKVNTLHATCIAMPFVYVNGAGEVVRKWKRSDGMIDETFLTKLVRPHL